MRSVGLGLVLLTMSACDASSLGVETLRFACTSDRQCLPDYVCRKECVRADSLPDEDAGVDPQDAGPDPDAGTELDGGSNGLSFIALPTTVIAGTCVALTLAATQPPLEDQTATLTIAPVGGARFTSDPACANTITSALVPTLTGQTSLFLKTITGGRVTLGATAPIGSTQQAINVTPVVRRGVCSIPAAAPPLPDGGMGASGLSRTCAVSPPVTDLSRAFTLAQTLTTGLQLTGAAQVHCRLATTSTLECTRVQDSDDADIRFQIAELPSGLRTTSTTVTDCTIPLVLDAGVNFSSAFILRSTTGSSTYFDDDDTPVFSPDAGRIIVDPPRCDLATAQAVELNGITVTRGIVDAGSFAQTFTANNLPMTGPNTALTTQTYTTDGIHDVCGLMVRGSLPSSTSIRISRGAGDAGCAQLEFPAIAYERIDFGTRAQVQQYSVSMDAFEALANVTITPVDLSRTIVFSSSQSVSGQGAGETDLADPRLYSSGLATFELTSATSVRVARGESSGAAAFTFYVVELNP